MTARVRARVKAFDNRQRRTSVKSFLTTGRKAACVAAVVAVAGTSLVSAPAANAADKDTLVFSPIALSIPALKGLSEGFKGVGGHMGYNTLVLDPNFNPVKQAQQLNAVINSGKADAGWVISVKPAAIAKTARLAQSKRVPLVLNGVPKDYGFVGPQRGLSFARIDYNKVGAAMGVTLGQCINEKLGGKAEVLLMTSQAGTAGREEMDAATKKWLASTAPGATVVQTIEQSDRASAQADVSAALQAHPNIKAITGANDEGALGALSAFAAAGKTLPCITENGGNPEVLAAVESGKIYASAALQFEADLMQTFAELGRLLKTPRAVGKLMSVPVKTFTS
jgi:ABC-type sugar transport system substrate-binding protein